MENPSRNLPKTDSDIEPTVVLSNDAAGADPENLISTLPLKSQDRYTFIRSIGFGGMKGVLLVHDRDTDRDVAMAIMPDFRDRSRQDLNRFVREARITARLEHPNIVPVYDLGIDASGSPFFIMKYLRGSTLAVILRRLRAGDPEYLENYTLTRRLQIFVRVCNAVAFAHSMDICHYDLKPGNIHCGDFGEVQVIDWGLAGGTSAEEGGHVKGTPGYMAPELIAGLPDPGKAADIYALGALLYAILTLDSPLAGLPRQEILRRTVAGRIASPSRSGRQFPPGLEAICRKAMALDPAERYVSAVDIRRDVNAVLSGYAGSAEKASAVRTAFLFLRRNLSAVIIVVLLLVCGVFAWLAYHYARN